MWDKMRDEDVRSLRCLAFDEAERFRTWHAIAMTDPRQTECGRPILRATAWLVVDAEHAEPPAYDNFCSECRSLVRLNQGWDFATVLRMRNFPEI
jgi:hypothetical protein